MSSADFTGEQTKKNETLSLGKIEKNLFKERKLCSAERYGAFVRFTEKKIQLNFSEQVSRWPLDKTLIHTDHFHFFINSINLSPP